MTNIKIVLVTNPSDYSYSDYETLPTMAFMGDTPWEEVSDKDLAALKEWARSTSGYQSPTYLIIEESSVEETKPLVSEYLKEALAQKKKIEKQQKDEADRRAALAKKRKDEVLEKKRKQLEKLKTELGEV